MMDFNVSMRLKVKRDTFYVPDPNGGVYFRNNSSSFRMEGDGIDQWIDKLLPVFNGQRSLSELTEGLTTPYRTRVCEIAEVLYRNGFVRDISQDAPAELPEAIRADFASQIEFLDHVGGSGAYRFQSYRQAKVLAVGSGPFLVSLVSALLESGLPKVHVRILDAGTTDVSRLRELAAHARKTDPEADVLETGVWDAREIHWPETIVPYDFILYVSREEGLGRLRELHAACRKDKKRFLPVICLQHAGLAGPLVHPEKESCWESAWRRIHQAALSGKSMPPGYSSTTEAMLANVAVFECFKAIAGVSGEEKNGSIYLLDTETLEGRWHPFLPHPHVSGNVPSSRLLDFEGELERSSDTASDAAEQALLSCVSRLTSETTGLFHIWEEEDLSQLPLAQCRIRPVDPLSEGPASLLPDIVCSAMTHEGARREAGLSGIEAYVSRMAGQLLPYSGRDVNGGKAEATRSIGIGAGGTLIEGAARGLNNWLGEELRKRQEGRLPVVYRIRLSGIEDERCRYYLQAITTLQGLPMVGLGDALYGLPVVWVGAGGRWYGSAGLHATLAMRAALQQALMDEQNHTVARSAHVVQVTAVSVEEREPRTVAIPAAAETVPKEVLLTAVSILKQAGKRLRLYELTPESSLKDALSGVYGVLPREEGSL
ncbi:putative thiazole-containing bacteriocin maturation protein [Paenibacillus sp. MBLB4367]|uniref:putative thiazole-containing bacteriocin maturation protein n=1 Tax=Paenibacillus sp. MBLB4367 TaxID=3384767 RepID=UPI003907EECF